MSQYSEGDKSRGICSDCGLVETVFHTKDIKISQSNKLVHSILAGVCTKCGEVVSIPHQVVREIKKQIKKEE